MLKRRHAPRLASKHATMKRRRLSMLNLVEMKGRKSKKKLKHRKFGGKQGDFNERVVASMWEM
jgi:hypothetical protein